MPKELNISPNERIDFEDFEYGSRTFTVDSLKAHVTRLLSGGYRGGFVFEGFRVSLPALPGDMEVTIYNGIAIDRSGRLITKEDGNFFLNNPRSGDTVPLLQGSARNYIMVEYTLADADFEQRGFWDPTAVNSGVTDSGGDTVPQPKGKEFSISIPTRKAQSVTYIVSGTGFEDSVDSNKLRIPVAIIPVDTSGPSIDLPVGDVESARTTIIEKPKSRDAAGTTINIEYIQCADTRIFDDTGTLKVYKRDLTPREFTVGGVTVTEINFIQNDRDNNILWLANGVQVKNGSDPVGFPWEECEITDIVEQSGSTTTLKEFIKSASQYDCRPMFFAVTESTGSREEDPNAWPLDPDGERRTDSRQFKYWSGLSLVGSTDPTIQSVLHPSVSWMPGGAQKTVTSPPSRIETRLKQQQDFFRAIASLIEEIKYGYAEPIKGSWSETVIGSPTLTALGLVDTTGAFFLVDTNRNFTAEYVGASIFVVTGANQNIRGTISKVFGQHVCGVNGFTNPFALNDDYSIELNYADSLHKYVDTINVGSLREVYNARIDQFTDTYAEDLNRRLSMNKVATITVGDGVSTFGDFVGDVGLEAALTTAFRRERGAVIYVRAGDYTLATGAVNIGPNTTIVGEGIGVTNITFDSTTTLTPNYLLIRDYNVDYAHPGVGASVAHNICFKNLSLLGSDTPLLANAPLEFQTSPGVGGGGAPVADGAWRTSWPVGPGPGGNSPTYVDNLTFENVHVSGGSIGAWAPTTAAYDSSYAVYLVSDENYNLSSGNSNIKFLNSKFSCKGGALLLKTCRDVTVSNCVFESPSGAGFGGLEGITLASRCMNTLASMPFHGTVGTDGNIRVDNCTFKNPMEREPTSVTYPGSNKRGWITFTPSYQGVNNSISNCTFQGYLTGEAASVGGVGQPFIRAYEGNTQTGTCIVKCGGDDLLVTGCNFGNYEVGIISQLGILTVNDCRFFQVAKAVLVDQQIEFGPWDYTQFSGAAGTVTDWNYWSTMYFGGGTGDYFYNWYGVKTEVKGCTFSGQDTGSSIAGIDDYRGCIAVHPLVSISATPDQSDSVVGPTHTLSIDSCNFKSTDAILSTQNLKPTGTENVAGFIQNNWEIIELRDCTFSGLERIIPDIIESVAPWHDGPETTTVYSGRTNIIRNFIYSNNRHYKCSMNLGGDDRGLIAICADKLVVKGNIFDATDVTSFVGPDDLNPICSFGVGEGGLTFDGNEFTNCFPGLNNCQITMLEASIVSVSIDSDSWASAFSGSSGPMFQITRNTFVPTETGRYGAGSGMSPHGGINRVSNGVIVNAYYPSVTPLSSDPAVYTGGILHTDIGEHFWPKLQFNDNELYLNNGNFGFLSKQHTGHGGTPLTGDFNTYFANLWAWHDVEVKNNKITLNIAQQGVNYQHGNDLSAPLTFRPTISVRPPDDLNNAAPLGPMGGATCTIPFLGASRLDQPAHYHACVDLRSMARKVAGGSTPTAIQSWSTNTIANNNFKINSIYAAHIADQETQEYMGLRISKFPFSTVKIVNNSFNQAPLVLRWVFLNPYFALWEPAVNGYVGYNFQIDGNDFVGGLDGPVVHINSAIGFGYSEITSTGAVQATGEASLSFCNNIVTNPEDAMTANDWPYLGNVRFASPTIEGFLNSISVLPPASQPNFLTGLGGFGIGAQCYTAWQWQVCGNKLFNAYIIITIQDGGSANPVTDGTDFFYAQSTNANHAPGPMPPDAVDLVRLGFSYFNDNYFKTPYKSEDQSSGPMTNVAWGGAAANANSLFGLKTGPAPGPIRPHVGRWSPASGPVASQQRPQEDVCGEDPAPPWGEGIEMRNIVAGTQMSKWQQPVGVGSNMDDYPQPAIVDKNTLVIGDA